MFVNFWEALRECIWSFENEVVGRKELALLVRENLVHFSASKLAHAVVVINMQKSTALHEGSEVLNVHLVKKDTAVACGM